MTPPQNETAFDLSDAFENVLRLETQLDTLADVSAPETAELMATAFEQAGTRIEEALTRAARTGELSFEALVTNILTDLARIAADSLFEQIFSQLPANNASAQPVSVQLHLPDGRAERGSFTAQGQIASVLGQVMAAGGRWS